MSLVEISLTLLVIAALLGLGVAFLHNAGLRDSPGTAKIQSAVRSVLSRNSRDRQDTTSKQDSRSMVADRIQAGRRRILDSMTAIVLFSIALLFGIMLLREVIAGG